MNTAPPSGEFNIAYIRYCFTNAFNNNGMRREQCEQVFLLSGSQ